jgi:hypothetical protein
VVWERREESVGLVGAWRDQDFGGVNPAGWDGRTSFGVQGLGRRLDTPKTTPPRLF